MGSKKGIVCTLYARFFDLPRTSHEQPWGTIDSSAEHRWYLDVMLASSFDECLLSQVQISREHAAK